MQAIIINVKNTFVQSAFLDSVGQNTNNVPKKVSVEKSVSY